MSRKTCKRPKPVWQKIIDDGFRDPTTCPIDGVLKLALGDDGQGSQWAIALLRSMYNYGRTEAGVFLIGLLLTCGDDWEKRMAIAAALYDVQTEACVNVLLSELRRVKSTNATRRYLGEVIDRLSSMPPSLVLAGFEELAQDKSFTPWMRTRLSEAVELLRHR